MAHRSTNRYCRYTTATVGSALAILLVSLALNTIVNPLWVTPAPWSDEGFDDYKPIHKHPRTGKAGIAMRGGWDSVIIGSSRLDIALDPNHPLWSGSRVANLGLRGGNLGEFEPMLRVAIKHNQLKSVILGLDHYDLTSDVLITNLPAFQESPLFEAPEPLERAIRYYIGGSSTTMAIKAVNYRAKGRLASYDRYGQWVESLDGRPFRDIYRTDSLPQALIWIEKSKKIREGAPAKLKALRSIIDLCRQNDIHLVILIPPNHATYLSNAFVAGSPDPTFDTNRRLLFQTLNESDQKFPNADPVAVWDFCDFHPLNCEALPPEGQPTKMKYWIDGTHATPTIGALMLQCAINGQPTTPPGTGQPYGTRLTSSSLDSRTQSIREGFEKFHQQHPKDFDWAKRLYLEASETSEPH